MVVISASVCTKAGKIVFARQFVPISRIKIEEYIANFPKLIEAGKAGAYCAGKQVTHIETESIRYVYLPIEKLYLVLVTSKNSNIIEDLAIVKQLHQVLTWQCN